MNVSYKSYNCEDVGRMLKLDKVTIASWCRKGFINYTDVSEHKSKRPRYEISDKEVNRIKKLINKYGRRNWLMYNNKDEELNVCVEDLTPHEDITQLTDEEVEKGMIKLNNSKKAQFNVSIQAEDKKFVDEECKRLGISKGEYITQLIRGGSVTPTPAVEEKATPIFDADKFINQMLRIQDIKERLDNLEAERNQLVNELAMIKKEMIEVI